MVIKDILLYMIMDFDGDTGPVWRKGIIVDGYDKNEIRKDDYGTLIKFSDYGDRGSDFGWEVDHIKPVSEGGSNDISNLRPLQWKNNTSRQ